jgi:hypothetical protein
MRGCGFLSHRLKEDGGVESASFSRNELNLFADSKYIENHDKKMGA